MILAILKQIKKYKASFLLIITTEIHVVTTEKFAQMLA